MPGEADPFLAAAAIRNGGIVLTGDSDLLVFSGQEKEWGVVMMQDLSFSDSGVTARVFRPTRIAESLRYPLLEVAYQTFLDAQASLNQILERLQRVEERRRQGVGEQKIPDEFTLEYALPPLAKEPRRTVEEPRIGELLFLADEKKPAEERKMYFPFLIEDSQRAPAWETGTAIRALAYGLLFGDGEVREVFRRGTRISDSAVGCGGVAEKVARLAQAVEEAPESWWASIVLEEICDIAQARGQGPPTDNELSAAAASLLPKGALATGKVKKKWNWALLHMFAMTQAGWYSLLLLREVLAYLESCGIAVVGCDVENLETLKRGLLQLPDVLDLFDGQRFLGGFEGAQPEAKKIGKAVLARYWAADAAAAALVVEEEEAAEIGEAQDVEEEEEVVMVESPVNGNGKRPGAGVGQVLKPVVEAEMDLWSTVQSKSAKKRKRKKVVSAMAARGGGNKFAVLSTEM